jgi:NADH-quinone oxidoreductase subunit J
MDLIFFIAALVAIISTIMVITNLNAVHALLYLVVSLLAVSVIFFTLGAPFIAALEIIIYAGAIIFLFIFVIMMLNLGAESAKQESQWLSGKMWIGPGILGAVLLVEIIFVLVAGIPQHMEVKTIAPKSVGISLFSSYLLAVELAAFLLLAGIVGAYHLGRRRKKTVHRFLETEDTG